MYPKIHALAEAKKVDPFGSVLSLILMMLVLQGMAYKVFRNQVVKY